MRLADLKTYIAKKYHTGAKKLQNSPWISVLMNPHTGKRAAVFERHWDDASGTQIECCDIKCGQEVLRDLSAPYLGRPYRMQGESWVGVRFGTETDPVVVFRLLDMAMRPDSVCGCQIVLGKDFVPKTSQYHETQLPMKKPDYRKESRPGTTQSGGWQNRLQDVDNLAQTSDKKFEAGQVIHQDRLETRLNRFGALLHNHSDENQVKTPIYVETPIPAAPQNPVHIRFQNMYRIYQSGDCSFEQKSKNFYEQGKFMEDFEPDASNPPDIGDVRLFFPRYNDLTERQLLAYFCWRRNIRNGLYSRINISVAYIYLYELLNLIGTSSVRESLDKLNDFVEKYIKPGFGDETMHKNVCRWMLELAILNPGNELSKDDIMSYISADLIKRDRALIILQNPEQYSDREVFDALIEMGNKSLETSPAFQKNSEQGVHLFAQAWRIAVERTSAQKRNIFKECFGELYSYPWHPLGNAVYYQKDKLQPVVCIINECRKYVYDGVQWKETCYYDLNFNKIKLNGFIHETERKMRIYLKCGRGLKEKKEEAWAGVYIDEAIEIDKAEMEDARHPKVTICFSDLDKIRADAGETRDRLLTDEELNAEAAVQEQNASKYVEISANVKENREHVELKEEVCVAESEEKNGQLEMKFENRDGKENELIYQSAIVEPENKMSISKNLLDMFQVQILKALLQGKSVKEMILEHRGMPEIIADSINEAMYDEIGDSVVLCEEDTLFLVEDYREDIEKILGESAE